ncbi:Phasin protein [Cognatiyoonia koreensis]|uniref:Phasin protein n=1 Tax=Cognatiyoonia koreensis TaxID=364200 RepID=A0A1I0QHP5_9RHOB|nr:phasin family protein [Cognatiyoonia koreensis]SEW26510.1 Phasin protein [Cognatiyoonia koreensis]
MAKKTETDTAKSIETPLDAIAQLQETGLSNLMGMNTAWVEAISDMGAEVVSFVADRIKEDVKTQHMMLHCKNVEELQHIQAEFIQKAMDQYHDETGKLVEMSTRVFSGSKDKPEN